MNEFYLAGRLSDIKLIQKQPHKLYRTRILTMYGNLELIIPKQAMPKDITLKELRDRTVATRTKLYTDLSNKTMFFVTDMAVFRELHPVNKNKIL